MIRCFFHNLTIHHFTAIVWSRATRSNILIRLVDEFSRMIQSYTKPNRTFTVAAQGVLTTLTPKTVQLLQFSVKRKQRRTVRGQASTVVLGRCGQLVVLFGCWWCSQPGPRAISCRLGPPPRAGPATWSFVTWTPAPLTARPRTFSRGPSSSRCGACCRPSYIVAATEFALPSGTPFPLMVHSWCWDWHVMTLIPSLVVLPTPNHLSRYIYIYIHIHIHIHIHIYRYIYIIMHINI